MKRQLWILTVQVDECFDGTDDLDDYVNRRMDDVNVLAGYAVPVPLDHRTPDDTNH